MSKVSIIVPVYNTATKLANCLENLVNQTVKDIEIIIINDGSTDNSEEIIKKYKDKYSNLIKYYSKQNEGVSKTRNYGIEKAKSDYILFVDSDDYIEKDTIEKLMPYINDEIDMIKFKLKKLDNNGDILEKIDGPVFEKTTGQEAFNRLYSQDILIDSPCIYLIKKELFKRNNFIFQRTYHEDYGLIPLLIVSAETFVSISDYLYSYIQVNDSITRNLNYNKTLLRFEDMMFHYDNAMLKIENMKLDKLTKENIKIYYSNVIVLRLDELEEQDKEKYIKEIKKRKLYKNIKPRNLKQLLKRMLLAINIKIYLKMR